MNFSALVRASSALKPKGLSHDEEAGYNLVLRACTAPMYWIATNAGEDGGVVVSKVKESEGTNGFDAREFCPALSRPKLNFFWTYLSPFKRQPKLRTNNPRLSWRISFFFAILELLFESCSVSDFHILRLKIRQEADLERIILESICHKFKRKGHLRKTVSEKKWILAECGNNVSHGSLGAWQRRHAWLSKIKETKRGASRMIPIRGAIRDRRIVVPAPDDLPDGTVVVELVCVSEKIGLDESEWSDDPAALADWTQWLATIEPVSFAKADAFDDEFRRVNIEAHWTK